MASTMETYGNHDRHDGPFTEATEQRPAAPYAVAKLACEKYLAYMAYAYEFPAVIIRQTNAYGRPDNDFFVVERTISQMLRGDVCNLGAAEPWRNFLFIDDLVELYSRLLAAPNRVVGETFVTGPDNALPIRDLAEKIAGMLKWRGQINWDTIPARPGEIFYLNSDPRKAHRLLGWKPQVSLNEGLERTIELWRHKLSFVQV
jgi:dTDP-glucose 4,6-dehydratase